MIDHKTVIADQHQLIADLTSERDRLREAIQPFAKAASGIPDNWPGECVLTFVTDGCTCYLSYYPACCSDNSDPTIANWRRLAELVDSDITTPHDLTDPPPN